MRESGNRDPSTDVKQRPIANRCEEDHDRLIRQPHLPHWSVIRLYRAKGDQFCNCYVDRTAQSGLLQASLEYGKVTLHFISYAYLSDKNTIYWRCRLSAFRTTPFFPPPLTDEHNCRLSLNNIVSVSSLGWTFTMFLKDPRVADLRGNHTGLST